jgi:hypothetical protein
MATIGSTIRHTISTRLERALARLTDERGDVPGWVLITLMTAGLVVVIWALAGPALSGVFDNAISKVSGL